MRLIDELAKLGANEEIVIRKRENSMSLAVTKRAARSDGQMYHATQCVSLHVADQARFDMLASCVQKLNHQLFELGVAESFKERSRLYAEGAEEYQRSESNGDPTALSPAPEVGRPCGFIVDDSGSD